MNIDCNSMIAQGEQQIWWMTRASAEKTSVFLEIEDFIFTKLPANHRNHHDPNPRPAPLLNGLNVTWCVTGGGFNPVSQREVKSGTERQTHRQLAQ